MFGMTAPAWQAAAPFLAIAFAGGYALGAVPFGLLLTRLAGLGDIRRIGSGNIGATNVLRTGRKGLAAATVLLDGGKGTLAVLLGANWGPDVAVFAGAGAMLGHCYPVWLLFKGGKGVATALGILLGIAPLAGLSACATWLLVAVLGRYSSLSALVALGLSPVYAWLIYEDPRLTQLAVFIALLSYFRHKDNIVRLLRGKESKIRLR